MSVLVLSLLPGLLLLTCHTCTTRAELSPELKPCKYNDEKCMIKAANLYVKENYDGDASMGLAKLDPLHVSEIRIKQGADSPVNIDLKFKDNHLIGLKDVDFKKISGFDKNVKGKREVRYKTKTLSLVGDYSIDGKILILPIKGSGQCNMSMVNTDVILTFNGEPYEKNGEIYMRVKNLKMDTKPERVIYYYGNLFNGDKVLGDNMNLFLNENWSEIFEEVRVSVHGAFAHIFEAVLDNIFSRLPYEKFFIE